MAAISSVLRRYVQRLRMPRSRNDIVVPAGRYMPSGAEGLRWWPTGRASGARALHFAERAQEKS